jgi:hypothetical protein
VEVDCVDANIIIIIIVVLQSKAVIIDYSSIVHHSSFIIVFAVITHISNSSSSTKVILNPKSTNSCSTKNSVKVLLIDGSVDLLTQALYKYYKQVQHSGKFFRDSFLILFSIGWFLNQLLHLYYHHDVSSRCCLALDVATLVHNIHVVVFGIVSNFHNRLALVERQCLASSFTPRVVDLWCQQQ